MAKIVLGLGAPHTPMFPEISEKDGSDSSITRNFSDLRRRLIAAKPDVLVIFTSDHFVGFFYDNMPTFCVGTFESATGPYELSRTMPVYTAQGSPVFSRALLEYGIDRKFDLSWSEDLRVDHSVFVPLHFLTPEMNVPIVIINIRGHQPPLPRADRCFELGQMVGQFIAQWPGDERIAILASGNFSLEVGGPKMGSIDREWQSFVVERLRIGEIQDLISAATPTRMMKAGNTAGEVLNWIALAGALGARAATMVTSDAQPPESPRDAHAYAAWEFPT